MRPRPWESRTFWWPRISKSSKNEVNVDVEVDLYSALVRLRARENDVAYQTLASRDDLVSIARGHDDDVELLRGWRRELVGDELLKLRSGAIVLGVREGRLAVLPAR